MHASVDAAFVDIYTYQRYQFPPSVLNSGPINPHLTGARVVSEDIVVSTTHVLLFRHFEGRAVNGGWREERTQVDAYLIPPSSNEFASLTLHSGATAITLALSNQGAVEHLGRSLVILRDSTVDCITGATYISLVGNRRMHLRIIRLKLTAPSAGDAGSVAYQIVNESPLPVLGRSHVDLTVPACLYGRTRGVYSFDDRTITRVGAFTVDDDTPSESQTAFDGDLLCFRNLKLDEMTSIKAFDGYRGRMVFNCWGRTLTILDFV
ncbi:hypothetical protein BV22DRAFT_834990 [Leucogyrophana mollusca]|uniref:Uncharacterized protein n=1 Tax=Leucogyrophana mollusca TaxID=85980 RepID=A0ACB8B407_9AGAM|nr:hypothetical protein BV22DRAFT_834990 [Leucogyrophana mollusca]